MKEKNSFGKLLLNALGLLSTEKEDEQTVEKEEVINKVTKPIKKGTRTSLKTGRVFLADSPVRVDKKDSKTNFLTASEANDLSDKADAKVSKDMANGFHKTIDVQTVVSKILELIDSEIRLAANDGYRQVEVNFMKGKYGELFYGVHVTKMKEIIKQVNNTLESKGYQTALFVFAYPSTDDSEFNDLYSSVTINW